MARVAQEARISPATYARLERGESVQINTIESVARVFNVEIDLVVRPLAPASDSLDGRLARIEAQLNEITAAAKGARRRRKSSSAR